MGIVDVREDTKKAFGQTGKLGKGECRVAGERVIEPRLGFDDNVIDVSRGSERDGGAERVDGETIFNGRAGAHGGAFAIGANDAKERSSNFKEQDNAGHLKVGIVFWGGSEELWKGGFLLKDFVDEGNCDCALRLKFDQKTLAEGVDECFLALQFH